MPTISPDAVARAQQIRLVAMDVDGTLTDGRIYIGNHGEIMKAFSVRDGFGLNLLRRAGIQLAIITGRESEIVKRRAAELQIDAVVQGAADKGDSLLALVREFGLQPAQAAFVGDDWPDITAMRLAGLAATVSSAPLEVTAVAHWIGSKSAGDGAIRQFAEWLLDAQGRLVSLRKVFQA